jgi:hypothetical protein
MGSARGIAARHVAWLYGPCWLDVVYVLETIRRATPEQLSVFAHARNRNFHRQARVMATSAAKEAGRRDAIKSAYQSATKVAASVLPAGEQGGHSPARDASRAACVRDLIGSHGYTREHHNALMSAFAVAFVPAHLESDDDGT